VEDYEGPLAFGMDRKTDENAVIVYLQKFSDDRLLNVLRHRMSDQDLTALFELLSGLMNRYLSEAEYHALFLREGG
jgi:hypothetical protein